MLRKKCPFLGRRKKIERRKVRFHLEQMQRVLLQLSLEQLHLEIELQLRSGLGFACLIAVSQQINKTQLSLNVAQTNV